MADKEKALEKGKKEVKKTKDNSEKKVTNNTKKDTKKVSSSKNADSTKKANIKDAEIKEKKKTSTSKTTEKKDVVSKKASKEDVANKKVATKKSESKKTNTKKSTSTKKETSVAKKTTSKKVTSKDVKEKKKVEDSIENKASSIEAGKELVELNKNKKIKEESIIAKIKSFLAKIAEMQEEAKKEIQEIKENIKVKKEKTEALKNKEKTVKTQTNYLLEYYDLPYRYNETVVKVLAQTPKRLFVYWDISDKDREKYIKSFGENFFMDTYPVLLLFNEEKQYIKEIVINDFANSWYIDINDPKTKYTIQLGRKFKTKPEIVNIAVFEEEKIILQTDYLPIAVSNKIEAPNDHILFENFTSQVMFKNVKTNKESIKDIRSFDKKIAKAYNLKCFYEVYKDLYKDGIENGMFDLNNPTSGKTSSSFK